MNRCVARVAAVVACMAAVVSCQSPDGNPRRAAFRPVTVDRVETVIDDMPVVTVRDAAVAAVPASNPVVVDVDTATTTTVAPFGLSDAVASVPYPTHEALPGWVIVQAPARVGLEGLTRPAERRIDVHARGSWTVPHFRHVVAHEIGHAVDVTLLDDAARREWADARGHPNIEWWPNGDGVTDFGSGAGDFAESFAWVMLGGGEWFSTVAGPPDANQEALLRRLVDPAKR